jgi:Peptidase_C39 like family
MAERVFASSKKPITEQKCSGTCKQKPSFDSTESISDRILQFQRTAGNRAVQRLVKSGVLQRQEFLPDHQPQSKVEAPADQERLQQLQELLTQITQETARSIQARAQLESLPPESSSNRENIETNLNESRLRLINLLKRRISLLEQEINSLNLRIGPNPASRIGGQPELEQLGYDLLQHEREVREHQQQLRPLKLWHTRLDIQAIQQEIEQVNRDILTIPPQNSEEPTSDMNDPRARELMERRTLLEEQKRKLAASMTSKALRYRQGDPRWGSKPYGACPDGGNIAAAGCGPTSLAILLNYMFQEDPELVAGGDLEFVKPPKTADYAVTHGRKCGDGTSGETMVTNVHTQWEGFRGTRINLEQATAALLNGNLVIFHCRNCTGQKAEGGEKTYKGHFMVLNGVNQDNTVFNVIDPAGANVITISRAELKRHSLGFWTIERK